MDLTDVILCDAFFKVFRDDTSRCQALYPIVKFYFLQINTSNSPFYLAALVSLILINCTSAFTFKKINELSDYPSGSGMAFFNNHIYLIGDDAGTVLIVDTALNKTGSIKLIESQQKRISKDVKQDLEAAAVVRISRSPAVLLVGSGSLDPYRSNAWLIFPDTKQKIQINLNTFYKRIKSQGIDEVNIEGVAAVPGGIVLANRGNKTFAKNHLIFTEKEFWKQQDSAVIKVIKVGTNTDTAFFNGVSGAEYSRKTDRLFLTVSTENTFSSREDGTIGKSYLWIINDISSKKRLIAINPDKIIDLAALDKRFAGHKIESVCIIAETRKETELVFAADDDKGTTVLFKIEIKNRTGN